MYIILLKNSLLRTGQFPKAHCEPLKTSAGYYPPSVCMFLVRDVKQIKSCHASLCNIPFAKYLC